MPSKFTEKEKKLLAAALIATFADVQTTKDALRAGEYKEDNPLLGKNPSGSTLDQAGMVAGLAGAATARLLPSALRAPFLGAWAGVEGALALNNMQRSERGQQQSVVLAGLGGALGALLASKDMKGLGDVGIEFDSKLQPKLSYKKKF